MNYGTVEDYEIIEVHSEMKIKPDSSYYTKRSPYLEHSRLDFREQVA